MATEMKPDRRQRFKAKNPPPVGEKAKPRVKANAKNAGTTKAAKKAAASKAKK